MPSKSLLFSVLLLMVLIALAMFAGGCPPRPAEDTTLAPELPDVAPLAEGEAAPATEFAWSHAPNVESIPDSSIIGMINGKPFEARTVRVKKGENGPEITISDGSADTPTGVIIEDTGVELRFPMAEGTTGQFTKTFDDEVDFDTTHAFYWYPQGEGKGPMSVNPVWGCAVEITDWNLTQDPEDEDILGSVKGKIAITFDDEQKSWLTGTFDAVYYKW